MSTASTNAASTVNTQGYSAIRVVGSLLTADLIGRIGAGDPDLKGLRSEDYGLTPGRRLGEAASYRWDELLGAYRAFQKRLADAGPGDSAVSLTRNRWLLPLFEQLGFGRLQHQRANLTAEGRVYPVSHVWGSVPIHLVAWERDLDKHRGGNGNAGGDRAPQSMLQEFLNASDDHLWGIVSNGQKLRILRDAASLSEAAFIEFDLESIFDGELYSDFVLLFALAHASRFEPHTPEGAADGAEAADEDGAAAPAALTAPSVADCWLEQWRTEGDKTGVRFRDKLRDGLTEALQELGTGFLEDSPELREKLRTGVVSRYDLRNELLRLAYQVLFLFVAEDKGALLDPRAGDAARKRYRTYFSTERLRRIAAERIGDRHDDLWRTLVIVLEALGTDEGRPELGLPPLGGLYFTAGALEESATGQDGSGTTGDTRAGQTARAAELLRESSVTLANRRLLAAVRHLTRVKDHGGRWQRVDYQHLDAEELGSIYESLLELIPHLDTANRTFELKSAAGNDRKTTGSYYTPSPLVETLLDSALDPVIKEYGESKVPADLLKVTVCDPACGSGHFLVAAARRIARAYAVLEAGDEEPTPDAVTKAMPEVVRNCIYGVDLNPLAVELTKVSLWLASLEPGKPLAFLDPHIKVGNALLGTTPKLLEQGVPDGAFKVLEGDESKIVAALKKRNKAEHEAFLRGADDSAQSALFSREGLLQSNSKLADAARKINDATKPGLEGVREQARRLRDLDHSPEKRQQQRMADAWCAAFVWPKRAGAPDPVTTHTLERIDGGRELTWQQQDQLDNLTHRYRFFHWHLEFPDVFPGVDGERPNYNAETGWQGGFACVLGNPPWERVKLQEKEFFDSRAPEIAKAPNKAKRQELIDALAESEDGGTALLREFHEAKNMSEGISLLLRDSGRYPRTGSGDVNTYSVFAETASVVIGGRGRFGLVLPTGIGTDATTAPFFSDLVDAGRIAAFLEFENEAFILSRAVHHSVRFCLLSATGTGTRVEEAKFAFGARYIGDLATRTFTMPPEDIRLVNPNTGTLPLFRSREDAEITFGIYRRVPVLLREGVAGGNPWGVSFMTMFHMSNDSHLFHTREELEKDGWRLEGNVFVKDEKRMLPLYEAKMLHHYDHRWGTYEGQTEAQANVGTLPRLTPDQHSDPEFLTMPRYWAPEFDVPTGKHDRKGNPTYFSGVTRQLGLNGWDREWLLGWRDICRTTDERTMISAAFPRTATPDGTLLMLPNHGALAGLNANLSSFVLDYVARQKSGGTHLKFFTAYQLPVIPPGNLERACPFHSEAVLLDWVTIRVIELTYNAWDMQPFALDLGDSGNPYVWDVDRRFLIRCELDAALFHLYGTERWEVEHIMEAFPVVKERDVKAHGSYRTKNTILQIYDAMAKAAETGEPYKTVLDPPPGEGPRHPERD